MPGGDNGTPISWREFHAEWRQLTDDLRERDEEQRGMLEEIRDSLGAMHGRFETLTCEEHRQALDELAKKIHTLDQRIIDWPRVANAVPLLRPKWLLALMGALAAFAGWDWWDRFSGVLEKWLK